MTRGMTRYQRSLFVMLSIAAMMMLAGCELDAQRDIPADSSTVQAEYRDVTVTALADNLNYPTTARFITSEDAQGTGSGSVLKRGNILIANAGMIGTFAHSLLQLDPNNGDLSVFSSRSLFDVNGEPAIDRPVGISFPGPYPWIANATWCFGAVSVLDATPGSGYDGPNSQAGEPISGPMGNGIYGCNAFKLTAISVTPGVDASGVPLSAVIVVRFSLPVDPSTVNADTFDVALDDVDAPTGINIDKGSILGNYYFSADLRTVTFLPSQPLVSSSTYKLSRYEITLDDKILDIYGGKFDADLYTPETADDFISTFTTEIEQVPPRIISIYPSYYEHVTQNMAVILTFSEPVRQSSIDSHSFKIIKGYLGNLYTEEEISGDKYWYDGNRVFAYIPDDTDFAESCMYYVLATGTLPSGFPGIEDRAGNALDGDNDGHAGGDFWSCFYTRGGDAPPNVVSITPKRGATNVAVTTAISVIFSEPLSSGTISSRSFLLFEDGDTAISGIVTRSSGYIEATFTPYEPLPFNARIDVVLTAEIEDVEGNPLDGNYDGIGGDNYYSWFYTGVDPDNFPPQVASIQPSNGQSDVPIGTAVTVMFTKEVDPLTVNSNTFTLQLGTTVFPSTITMMSGNTGAILTPIANLSFDTVYSVTLTDAITDLGGRALDGDADGVAGGIFYSTFRTQTDPSAVPVYVITISPADGQTGVSTNTSVVATFSRTINPATIWTGNFYMFDGGDTVLGTISVSADNLRATFTPNTALAEGTVYHVQLLDTIADPFGEALDGDHNGVAGGTFNSQFTTGFTVDLVINEFLPSPASDWDGDSSTSSTGDEWIELYNNSPVPVDISGMYLGDLSNPTRFQFGTETIGAYSFRVIYGSEQGSLSLNNGGDTVYLIENDGTTIIDSYSYPTTGSDISVRRVPDGSSTWANSSSCAAPGGSPGCPTPGTTNGFTSFGKVRPGGIIIEHPAQTTAMAGHRSLIMDNWGFAGITYGGNAPDTQGSNSVQFFTSHANLNDVYVFDFDTGYYSIGGSLTDLIETPGPLAFVQTLDSNEVPITATGKLFISLPQWNSIGMIKLMPSGPIGQAGNKTMMDDRTPISFYPLMKDPVNPTIMHPTDVVYDQTSGNLFIANRGNGTVAEMTTNGIVVRVYDTKLGMDTIAGIDVGTLSGKRAVIVTCTGGPAVYENSGPHGAIYSFFLN